MTLLVTGASGNAGREVVAALVRRGLRVRAATCDGRVPRRAEGARFDLDAKDLLVELS